MEVGKTRPEITKTMAGNKKKSCPEQELKEKIKQTLLENREKVNKEEIEFLLKRF
jgi:hypothetical protein